MSGIIYQYNQLLNAGQGVNQSVIVDYRKNPLSEITNEQMNTERSHLTKILFLEEKLRKADEILRESSIEIKAIREERDNLKLENDRLKINLDQTQS
mmetsp:Transcript_23086/g.22496  ORF Transcript_23086/g.22496 Transcript_23086/m.22496 type:complete len:97 (+) Transcript_23086:636-926(+)